LELKVFLKLTDLYSDFDQNSIFNHTLGTDNTITIEVHQALVAGDYLFRLSSSPSIDDLGNYDDNSMAVIF